MLITVARWNRFKSIFNSPTEKMTTSTSSTNTNTLAFMGGGQMASALISGLIQAGRDSASILVIEPNPAQREHLETTFGIKTAPGANQGLSTADVVVWAVKPQVMQQVIDGANAFLGHSLHVSIAAGLSVKTLSQWLRSDRVVRAMPNTAALVGAGVTGLVAAPGVSLDDRSLAEEVLTPAGHTFWVADDERIDAVTAVSGSGPAYVFHFLEAFQAAAQAIGFDPVTARDLVLKTAAGAIEQARAGEDFATLRDRVTSKRGTTEAALAVLNAQGTPNAIREAVQAAYTRAGQLSLELSGNP